MDETWLDKFNLPTPSLTRASSASSDDGQLHENKVESLVKETSRFNITEGVESSLRQKNDANILSQGSHVVFVDEPESYEESEFPILGLFGSEEPENTFVSSPEAVDFPLPFLEGSDNLECEGSADDSESQILHGMQSDGLVCSPASEEFHVGDAVDHTRDEPLSGFQRRREGRRKALLIGIKYYRNKRFRSLKGPHHDVCEVQKLLQDVYGWSAECFRTLKDDNGMAENQPTLGIIRNEIKQLVEDARPGDHLFFYYSGHGGQVRDEDGDEEDGMDEVIVSCDGKYLVDDELHDTLVKPLPAGCHLTALLDCCSSGTSLDLPYNAIQSPRESAQRTRPITRKHSQGNVVLLSACADAERAYEKQDQEDTFKRVRGMLTKAFIDSLKTRRKSTYDELITSVRSQLKRKDTMQNPQLSSSRRIDMNAYFDL